MVDFTINSYNAELFKHLKATAPFEGGVLPAIVFLQDSFGYGFAGFFYLDINKQIRDTKKAEMVLIFPNNTDFNDINGVMQTIQSTLKEPEHNNGYIICLKENELKEIITVLESQELRVFFKKGKEFKKMQKIGLIQKKVSRLSLSIKRVLLLSHLIRGLNRTLLKR